MSAYTLDDFFDRKKKYMPSRSTVIRRKIGRQLVRLARRIDRDPNVKYTISHHHYPMSWQHHG